MKIIANSGSIVQGVKMSINEKGFEASFKGATRRGVHLEGVKRGTIKGWSKASVRRLRETLFFKSVKDSHTFGVTLTVPWRDGCFDFEKCGDEFRRILKNFRFHFMKDYPNSSLVYRIELQQRKAPHVHAVAMVSKKDEKQGFGFGDWIKAKWWFVVFEIGLHGGDSIAFMRHGVVVKSMDGRDGSALFRYLADHASKRKQAQLGWKGRQWGVMGSRNLSRGKVTELPPFPDKRSESRFWRDMAKLTAYNVKSDKSPFGSRKIKGRRKWGVSFVRGGGQTVLSCYRNALKT